MSSRITFLVILYFFSLTISVISSKKELISVFNEEDELIGQTSILVQEKTLEFVKQRKTVNTIDCSIRSSNQTNLLSNIITYFINQNASSSTFTPTLLAKGDKVLINGVPENVIILYPLSAANPCNPVTPCELQDGSYTWLFGKKSQTSAPFAAFGAINDAVEWGSKHFQLANQNSVFVGGEMVVSNSNVSFNLQSGTFSQALFLSGANIAQMIQRTKAVFASLPCSITFVPDTNNSSKIPVLGGKLLNFPLSQTQLDNVCKKVDNSNIMTGGVFTDMSMQRNYCVSNGQQITVGVIQYLNVLIALAVIACFW